MKRVVASLFFGIILFAACGKEDADKVIVPKAVDLGIKVDGVVVKWASCNLGAKTEYEPGEYYMWGETETIDENPEGTNRFRWYFDENYYLDGDILKMRYHHLLPEDDAAHVKLGGTWRLPKEEEWRALMATSTSDHYCWHIEQAKDKKGNPITNSEGLEVWGVRITYLDNGNSIFLPNAGYKDHDCFAYFGKVGFYWSSTLNYNQSSVFLYAAKAIHIQDGKASFEPYPRGTPMPIRAVCE